MTRRGYSGSFVNRSHALVTPPARPASTGRTRTSSPRDRVCAGVTRIRVDFGEPIQSQVAEAPDEGKGDELDPEHPLRLVRDRQEDRDEQDRDEQREGLLCTVSELLRLRDNSDPNRDRYERSQRGWPQQHPRPSRTRPISPRRFLAFLTGRFPTDRHIAAAYRALSCHRCRRLDLAFDDLSGGTFGQFVDDPDVPGVLVGGYPLLDEVA